MTEPSENKEHGTHRSTSKELIVVSSGGVRKFLHVRHVFSGSSDEDDDTEGDDGEEEQDVGGGNSGGRHE
ncbi:hypothetical protein CYMTET_11820 [Cymbomonas tetramitiformis]|uniref:Uncharacterized protein n=1 Tax=Cymbomonas tetramitiformis TaxID=36881 RepID=A0AAE0GLQ2_9CHLO|nr:hypothetical protein CYMTET_11820 [Cymbomonas tetramitiformis]